MKHYTAVFLLFSTGCLGWGAPRAGGNSNITGSTASRLQPSPEMQKVLKAFVGNWRVNETFEISESRKGETRQGTAALRSGPGFSLLEDYNSNGSAGELHFLGILWWDSGSQLYRFFSCANTSGCESRGVARWEGESLVNRWDEDIKGTKTSFRDSFTDITPSSFRLVSEGLADGKVVWRVVTLYERTPEQRISH
ncbi:MAG TPA: hypothetical protein VFA89_23085 [Terriglobales bacterium]|nr:hypothetical protein [Terriglobales bacterium]